MVKIYELNYFKFYIAEESGRLYVKDTDGISKPVKYAVYSGENELFSLRDYMNITGKKHTEAVKMLESCNAVLITHTFDIYFYDYESVEKFLSITGASEVIYNHK